MQSSGWVAFLLDPVLVAVVVLVAAAAFLSAGEAALSTASRGALQGRAERGDRGAARALALIEDRERMVGALIVAGAVLTIAATALATTLTARHIAGGGGVVVAVALMSLLTLGLGVALPRTWAGANPDATAARLARPVGAVVGALAPPVEAARALARGLLRLLRLGNGPGARPLAPEAEIAGAIALHHSEGGVEKDDRDRLLGALELGRRQVEEVMMHRRDIEMIDADAPSSEILGAALNSPHTRIPIFRGEPENIVGVIHAKDIGRAVERLVREAGASLEGFDVTEVAMEPYFVPDTTPLDEQLREFLRRRTHFALVVDEYGALQGLITLEDIIEEIVGDISDEHDVGAPGVLRLPDGSIEAEGVATIRDVNRACDWSLPDDEANTVAGLVIHEAQAIPEPGQAFNFHGFRFEVLERESNRVTRLRIRRLG